MDSLKEILQALGDPKSPDAILDRPGLYAFYGSESAWTALGLVPDPEPKRPLYVGKSEDSLRRRDLKTHFSSGRTGSSTLRRSLAALLKAELGLRGQPRNPDSPGHFANYGMSAEDEQKLTRWMRGNLVVATWVLADGVVLGAAETQVLREWQPPLNLSQVETRWSSVVREARKVMAREAMRWAAERLAAQNKG